MLSLVLGVLVASTPIDAYNRGKELFRTSYYEQAAALLSLFVEDPGNAPQKTVITARWMLAQAQFFTEDKVGATKQIKLLYKQNADLPDDLPPAFERFAVGLKPELKSDPPVRHDRPKAPAVVVKVDPLKADPLKADEPSAVTTSPASQPASMTAPRVITRASVPPWYVRGLPGGIGHLIAKDYIAGGVFIGLTVATAVLNIVFLALNARALRPDLTLPGDSRKFYIAQHVTAGLFYATLITSLIDGIAGVPVRAEAR